MPIRRTFLEGFGTRGDTQIWRYMDIEKLRSLLDDRALYFAAAAQFADRFEGSISRPHIRHRMRVNAKLHGSDFDFIMRSEESTFRAFRRLTTTTKISCWHRNKHESAAMWERYLREGRAVAVRSTVSCLKRALGEYRISPQYGAEDFWFGTVKYIDFDNDSMNTSNLSRFFFKRKSFSHEREFRAMVSLTLAEEYGVEIPEDGIRVPVDIPTLIQEIRIAPELKPDFVSEVRRLARRAGFTFPIRQSDMAGDPIF